MDELRTVPLADLLPGVTTSACHIETRDHYTPDDPLFTAWLVGEPITELARGMDDWAETVRSATARGIGFRRVRVVREPASDYIRFEHEMTSVLNIPVGEDVRWLSRRHASDLMLPGNDLWLLDGRIVRFGHFDGPGNFLGHELTENPVIAEQTAEVFDKLWSRAVPHEYFTLS